MTIASISRLKTHLSGYLKKVKKGNELLITEHNKPVAKIIPFDPPAAHVAELVQSGLARPPQSRAGFKKLGLPPSIPENQVSLLATLLAEREEGR